MSPVSPFRFALAYGVLAVLAVAGVLFGAAGLFLPALPHDLVHRAQLGSDDLARLAEQRVAQAAAGQGLTVLGERVLSESTNGDSASVRIQVKTVELGNLILKLSFSKSLWQVTGIGAG